MLHFIGVESVYDQILASIKQGVEPDAAAAVHGLDIEALQNENPDFARAVSMADAHFAAEVSGVLYEGAVLKRSIAAARYLLERRAKRKHPAQLELSLSVSGPAASVVVPSNGRGPTS